MKQNITLKHEFVEYIPDHLKDKTIYVSITYATVVHKCCCGCGNEVITPLSPTDWRLIFDGQSISLDPSIGNWSFACQSHYWIKQNKVLWAPRWSRAKIDAGRANNALGKRMYLNSNKSSPSYDETTGIAGQSENGLKEKSLWWRLRYWLFGTS